MARTFEKIPPEILTLKLLCQYKSKGKRWQPRTSDKNMDHFRYVNAILRPYLSCVTNLYEHKYSFSNYHIMSGCGGSCISTPPSPPPPSTPGYICLRMKYSVGNLLGRNGIGLETA
jgi:hypothetical protein